MRAYKKKDNRFGYIVFGSMLTRLRSNTSKSYHPIGGLDSNINQQFFLKYLNF